MTRRRCAGGTAAGLMLLLAAAGCGSSSTSSAGAQGGGTSVTVDAQNTAFTPSSVSVPAGARVTVTFDNKDGVTHSLTFDDNSQSVDADGGATKTLTFTAPASGTVTFHCKFHASMHGSFTVGGGGAGGSGSGSSTGGGGY